METLSPKTGGGKCDKAGRNSAKCKKYKINKAREKNKIKNVLQSNGRIAATEYAEAHELQGYLRGLLG
jgi:hypothetical protein